MFINRAVKLRMLEEMMLIRRFEEKIREVGIEGRLNQVLGEEAILVGVRNALNINDILISMNNYYGHRVEQGTFEKILAKLNSKMVFYLKNKNSPLRFLRVEFNSDASNENKQGVLLNEKVFSARKIFAILIDDNISTSIQNLIDISMKWKFPIVFISVNRKSGENEGKDFLNFIQEKGEFEIIDVDGRDVFAVYEAVNIAITHKKMDEGPRFIKCNIYKDETIFAKRNWKTMDKFDPVEICKRTLLEDQLPYSVLETLEQRVEHISEIGIQIMKEGASSSLDNAYKEAYANMYRNSLLKG